MPFPIRPLYRYTYEHSEIKLKVLHIEKNYFYIDILGAKSYVNCDQLDSFSISLRVAVGGRHVDVQRCYSVRCRGIVMKRSGLWDCLGNTIDGGTLAVSYSDCQLQCLSATVPVRRYSAAV